MFVDNERNMRNLKSFLSRLGSWHVGYSDAFVHLLAAGNRAKHILFTKQYLKAQRNIVLDNLLGVSERTELHQSVYVPILIFTFSITPENVSYQWSLSF